MRSELITIRVSKDELERIRANAMQSKERNVSNFMRSLAINYNKVSIQLNEDVYTKEPAKVETSIQKEVNNDNIKKCIDKKSTTKKKRIDKVNNVYTNKDRLDSNVLF